MKYRHYAWLEFARVLIYLSAIVIFLFGVIVYWLFSIDYAKYLLLVSVAGIICQAMIIDDRESLLPSSIGQPPGKSHVSGRNPR